ncbi:uncharacterized protein LOC115754707 [Rhodamnia argentea]|uniref:Uncharacterized protein LOC115754707 n=1 Tax=Rhodamnia argentea TaxID=178133 RepID=A0A8B8QR59_9MYRT|nr:uncharacterized protein LOC115754707 [Rhodamnia argentea]
MSRDSRVLSAPSEDADGIRHSTVPELVASLRSSFRPLEDLHKFLAAIEEKWGLEAGTAEALRKENGGLSAKLVALTEGNERLSVENEGLSAKLVALGEENERLRVRVASLESEHEAREGRAEEVDSLMRENVELKRKNDVLKSKVEGKYVELDLRVLELELDMAFLRSKELLLPDGAGEMDVPSEANGFDKDDEDGRNGNGSQAGGGVSSSQKADFRKGTCGGVLRGDGSPALKEVVEIIDLDDDSTGTGCLSGNDLPSRKLTSEEHLGDNNQEKRKSELKRKGRESLRERDSSMDNIKLETETASASAKPNNESSSLGQHKKRRNDPK